MKTSKWWPTPQVRHNFVPEWHVALVRLGLRHGRKFNRGRGWQWPQASFHLSQKTLKVIIKDRNEHIPDMRNLMESLCTLVCSSAEKTVDLYQHRQGKNGLQGPCGTCFPCTKQWGGDEGHKIHVRNTALTLGTGAGRVQPKASQQGWPVHALGPKHF